MRAAAWGQAQLDRVPGARRLVTELSRVELVDRSLALGAQALLALLPFLVVLAAFAPAEVGTTVIHQVRDAMGLTDADVRPALQALQGRSVRTDSGVFGAVISLVSATSFSRALQRMYARVFDLRREGGRGRLRRSAVWLPVWLVYLASAALLGRWPEGSLGGWIWVPVVVAVLQLGFWWWSAHYLLLGLRSWGELLPAALLTTAGSLLLMGGSGLVMPRYPHSSVEQFGSFGLVLAAATWLVAFGGVLVGTCLTGRLIAEHLAWRRFAGC
jgi:membrane protein